MHPRRHEPQEISADCPMCRRGLRLRIGTHGKLHWFRCRDCGMDSHHPTHDQYGIAYLLPGEPGEDPDDN